MGENSDGKKGFTIVDRRFWAQGEGDVDATEERSPDKPTYVRQLEKALEEKDKKISEFRNRHQESLAEFENARLRVRRDLEKDIERARRAVIAEFLDVLDNLERALEMAKTANSSAIIDGVTLVRDLFVTKLKALDVERIEALGMPFDPKRHEAVTVVPCTDDEENGIVLGVINHGYQKGGEVLRPAQVAVSRRGS